MLELYCVRLRLLDPVYLLLSCLAPLLLNGPTVVKRLFLPSALRIYFVIKVVPLLLPRDFYYVGVLSGLLLQALVFLGDDVVVLLPVRLDLPAVGVVLVFSRLCTLVF